MVSFERQRKMKTTIITALIGIVIVIGLVFLIKHDNKINEEKKQIATQQADFEYIKTLTYIHMYNGYLQEVQIYRDKHTGILYMFYYGHEGISISRYYEKE